MEEEPEATGPHESRPDTPLAGEWQGGLLDYDTFLALQVRQDYRVS
jgi:hypothetical protein